MRFTSLLLLGCTSWPGLEPAGPEPRDAAGVVLRDEESIHFSPDRLSGKPVVECRVHERARILTQAGASLAKVIVHYSPAIEVVSLRARTIAPDGSQRQFGRGDAADVPAYASYMM